MALPSFNYNFVLYDGMCSWLHTCYMLVYANCYEMICIYYDMWMLCCIWWIDIFMIWYVEDMLEICYVTVMIHDMIQYVHDVDCYIWKHENVMIWHICDMNDMIWWTCKTTSYMKYISDIRMKDMINNMKNDMIWRKR